MRKIIFWDSNETSDSRTRQSKSNSSSLFIKSLAFFILAIFISNVAFAARFESFQNACDDLKGSFKGNVDYEMPAGADSIGVVRCALKMSRSTFKSYSSDLRDEKSKAFDFDQLKVLQSACPGKIYLSAIATNDSILSSGAYVLVQYDENLVVLCQ